MTFDDKVTLETNSYTKAGAKISNSSPSETEFENPRDIEATKKICNKNINFIQDIEIESYLASGAYGVVYKGIAKKSNKKVALKIEKIKKNLKSIKDKNNYKREMNIMNKLKHKNIVDFYGIYGVGKNHNIPCLVLDFAKYGDLEQFKQHLHKKVFNESTLAYFTKQILNGLLYCKKSNILHLDIKPYNLIIDENLNVKLSDFGISLELAILDENKTTKLPTAGTSVFMSPEIVSKSEINFSDINKVDIYSLGVTLFYLAFNFYPYQMNYKNSKNYNQISEKINNNQLTIPCLKKHSETFRCFLKKLLNKNINERLSIEEALNDPWIKAADLIFEEKEKILDLEKFLINMVSDNIHHFNKAVNKCY